MTERVEGEGAAVQRSLAGTRRKLRVILALGVVVIALAGGVRVWWAKGEPARAANLARLQRQAALDRMLQEAQAGVTAAPTQWLAHHRLGIAMMAHGRVEDALASWRKGTEVAPTDSDAWQMLANAYLGEKRFVAAEETFRTMAEKWPKNPAGFEGLAVVLRHSGRFREALEPARTAVRLSSDRAEPHYVLGTVIQEIGARAPFPTGETGLLEEGRKHLLEAGKTLKDHPDIDYRRGRICLLIRRFDEALEALERSVARDPNRALAWVALSEARMRTGKLEDSIAAARKSCEIGPLEPEARMALGRALLLKSDRTALEEAAAAFTEAIRLNPESAQAHQRLGTALLRLDRVSEAGAAFEAAYRQDPHDPYSPQQLAQIYQRVGKPEEAAKAAKLANALSVNERLLSQLQRASASHPENPLIHRGLADRYRELGWFAPAEDEYKLALAIIPKDARSVKGLAEVRRKLAEKSSP